MRGVRWGPLGVPIRSPSASATTKVRYLVRNRFEAPTAIPNCKIYSLSVSQRCTLLRSPAEIHESEVRPALRRPEKQGDSLLAAFWSCALKSSARRRSGGTSGCASATHSRPQRLPSVSQYGQAWPCAFNYVAFLIREKVSHENPFLKVTALFPGSRLAVHESQVQCTEGKPVAAVSRGAAPIRKAMSYM